MSETVRRPTALLIAVLAVALLVIWQGPSGLLAADDETPAIGAFSATGSVDWG